MTDEALLEKARQAARNAYCPYSQFPVGAALVAEDGEVYISCNVENASYGLSMCAERTAIYAAVAAGNTKIKKIALTCLKGDMSRPATLASCGACRQVIGEFIEPSGSIIVDGVGSFTIDDILPGRFSL